MNIRFLGLVGVLALVMVVSGCTNSGSYPLTTDFYKGNLTVIGEPKLNNVIELILNFSKENIPKEMEFTEVDFFFPSDSVIKILESNLINFTYADGKRFFSLDEIETEIHVTIKIEKTGNHPISVVIKTKVGDNYSPVSGYGVRLISSDNYGYVQYAPIQYYRTDV